ncbi:MAG: methyltransferase domain-containing protein [Pseudomonadota bacterium]
MADDPDLDSAYALETPQDSVRLYKAWADSYDGDFARNSDYILHEQVARHFANIGGHGPVLDVGAGTGLCGAAMRARGIDPVDGTDISPDMLAQAAGKGIYRHLFVANLLEGLTPPDGLYQGAVSSGTFTHGHVGPEGLDRMLDVVQSGARVVISVNAAHYSNTGFEAKLAALGPHIHDLTLTECAIYGPAARGPHAKDTALLVAFRKA